MSDRTAVATISSMARMASILDGVEQFELADRMDRVAMSKVVVDRLYHTTSIQGLRGMLSGGVLNSDRFVSMSERPIYHGDISGNDVVIVFDAGSLAQHLMRVEYDPAWSERYPEHSDYVAGEGWREQYIYEGPDEDGMDEDELDEMMEQDYAAAAQDAFEAKSQEREWISILENAPIPFSVADVLGVIVNDPELLPSVRQIMRASGLDGVPISVPDREVV